MAVIVTLLAAPEGVDLEAAAAAVRTRLAAAGAAPGEAESLARGVALRLPVEAGKLGPASLAQLAREALPGWPVDVAALPHIGQERRYPKLFIADMDSTMLADETLDRLAAQAGIGDSVAAITERAMAGELDFAGALRERVALLAGAGAGLLDRVRAELTPNPGAAELVAGMRAAGATTVLVSGGFTQIAEPVGAALGFDRVRANRLEIDGERLTGRVVAPVLDGPGKAAVLQEFVDRLGIAADQVVAIGDGANDLPMIRAAGLGIAYRGKPALKAEADLCLDHAALDACLSL